MNFAEVTTIAEELAKRYNQQELSPFPYENILKDISELEIYFVDFDIEVSGAIVYNKDEKEFEIFINQNKPKVRQNFTIAHELGHYFLHKDIIKDEEALVDGENYLDGNPALFRSDSPQLTLGEIEANNFAAAFLMPTALVSRAWEAFKNIEECAKLFNVSVTAMSIRLTKLGFVT